MRRSQQRLSKSQRKRLDQHTRWQGLLIDAFGGEDSQELVWMTTPLDALGIEFADVSPRLPSGTVVRIPTVLRFRLLGNGL